MPAIHRVTDARSSHGSAGETDCIEGSPNVFANGLAVQRVGDEFDPHDGHGGFVEIGSTTVFVNGLAVVRLGDAVVSASSPSPDLCSSVCAGPGSTNIFVGG